MDGRGSRVGWEGDGGVGRGGVGVGRKVREEKVVGRKVAIGRFCRALSPRAKDMHSNKVGR